MATDNNVPQSVRVKQALALVRVTVALLILIHGGFRLLMGGVAPFGEWLETQGFPNGYAFAMAVTVYELVGPILLLLGRLVVPIALGHIGIIALGLVMVHLPFGWFVVGAGRNGMEYSVLLIAALVAIAWADPKRPGKP
jgi:putative oxidoreductase